jgi:hypothetical protein
MIQAALTISPGTTRTMEASPLGKLTSPLSSSQLVPAIV